MSSRYVVSRSTHSRAIPISLGIGLVVVLGALPYLVYQGVTNTLVNLLILVTLASMWNVLAGYGGLISVGQQAYIGVGAYVVLYLAQHNWDPFFAIPVAIVVAVIVAVPASWFFFRLSGGYFAIATWVLAVVGSIVITGIPSIGGGTGAALPGFASLNATLLGAYTYWATLGVTVVALGGIYLLLRSRTGLVLTAVRDNEIGARSIGGKVRSAKRAVYFLSAGGCAAAGAMIAISQLNVQAANVFNIQWTAYMIFAVLIGGIGTIEGPIIGAIIFIVLQQTLASYNAVYLIIVGVVAVVVAIWIRGGIWGSIAARTSFRFFPVGFRLVQRPELNGPTTSSTVPSSRLRPRSGARTISQPTAAVPDRIIDSQKGES